MTMQDSARRHPALAYFTLTLAISWIGFLLVGRDNFLDGTDWETDSRFQAAVLVMLLGPPAAGIASTAVVAGGAGLLDLLARLTSWRHGLRWYAVALLVAPAAQLLALAILALGSSNSPAIFEESNKAALVLAGVGGGIAGAFVEELGWTGFAIPQLRTRFSIFATGIIVGVIWGAWHLLQMWWVGSTSAGGESQPVFLLAYFALAIAQLTAFRILMVWVYDGTRSVLMAVLMHGAYIFSTLIVFAPETIEGGSFLGYSAIFTALLWLAVAALALARPAYVFERPSTASR